jgi:hypothetical protein
MAIESAILRTAGVHPDASEVQMTAKDQKLAHSVAEFAQLSGLGRSFIYEQIKAGLLPVRKAGRRSLILHEEGQDWLASLPIAGQRRTSPSTS